MSLTGYASIPAHLLGSLTTHELAVYVVLSAHMNAEQQAAWPSHKRIADLSGMSATTVKVALHGLRDKGLVSWSGRGREDGGQTSNVYRLSQPDRPPVPSRLPPNREATTPQAGADYEPTQDEPTQREPGELLLIGAPPLPAATRPDPFDGFWTLYPRKVGKIAARRAWDRAMKATTAERVMEGLLLSLPAMQARAAVDGSKEFIPHPSTWLNEGRWEDEPESPAQSLGPAESRSTRNLRIAMERARAADAAAPRQIGDGT